MSRQALMRRVAKLAALAELQKNQTSTTLTATSTAMKIIDQPIGLRFLRGASLSIGSSTGSLGSSAK